MAVVVSIASSRDKHIVDMLRHALDMAEAGKLRSVGLCLEDIEGREDMCVAGGYRMRPGLGANAALRLSMKLTQLEDQRHAGVGFASPST